MQKNMEVKDGDLLINNFDDDLSQIDEWWNDCLVNDSIDASISPVKELLFDDLDIGEDEESDLLLSDYVKNNYFKEMRKYPVLKNDEIIQLISEYKRLWSDDPEGVKIRDKIINSNLRFVYKMAKAIYCGCKNTYKTENLNLNDLVQVWNLWLIKALDNYQEDEWKNFLTYARHLIVWNMHYYLKYESRFFKSESHGSMKQMREFVDRFFKEKWRYPVDKEAENFMKEYNQNHANKFSMDFRPYYKFYLTHGLISLDQAVEDSKNWELEGPYLRCDDIFMVDDDEELPYDDNFELTLKDVLMDQSNDIEKEINSEYFKEVSHALLGVLSNMEIQILKMYFWIDCKEALSLAEIWEKVWLSAECVRQIKEKWIKNIKSFLKNRQKTHWKDYIKNI